MQDLNKKLSTYLPWIVGGLLILMVFGWDIVANQTVFLLDYVPTPVRIRDWSRYTSIPLIWMAHDALIYVLGYIRGSKIYLLSIMIVTLMLGYRRGSWISTLTKSATSDYLPLLGMIIMVCNPVLSSRMGTQPGVWLGIILLGRGLYYLMTRRDALTARTALAIGGLWGIAMMSMNHASFMIAILLTVLVLVRARNRTVWISSIIIAVVVGLCNANWIVGGLIGTNAVVEGATTFSQANIEEFMTYNHSGLGPTVTSMLGYGFWGEKYGSAYAPTWSNPRRWVAGGLLWLLAMYGCYLRYRRDRRQGVYLMIIAVISLLLGVGIASDALAPGIQWIYNHVPGYRGLREPHKRIGLYMMILIPWMLLGYHKLAYRIHMHLPGWGSALCVAVIALARAPGIPRQMMGRYDATAYPLSYERTRDTLLQQGYTGTMVHMPWHSYHRCQRTRKVIANTLVDYMRPLSLITSDNIEIGGLYTNSDSTRSADIDEFVSTHDLGLLTKYGITDIMYTNLCADFKRYEWITQHSGLQLTLDEGDIQIYTIK